MIKDLRADRALELARAGRTSTEISEELQCHPKTVRGWVRKLAPDYFPVWVEHNRALATARHEAETRRNVARMLDIAQSQEWRGLNTLAEAVGMSAPWVSQYLKAEDPLTHQRIVRAGIESRDMSALATTAQHNRDAARWAVEVFAVPTGRGWHYGHADCPRAVALAAAMSGLTEDEVRESRNG